MSILLPLSTAPSCDRIVLLISLTSGLAMLLALATGGDWTWGMSHLDQALKAVGSLFCHCSFPSTMSTAMSLTGEGRRPSGEDSHQEGTLIIVSSLDSGLCCCSITYKRWQTQWLLSLGQVFALQLLINSGKLPLGCIRARKIGGE